MRTAKVLVNNQPAGLLKQLDNGQFEFEYDSEYNSDPVSLTMPVKKGKFHYENFPPFFDGLLPEGMQLEGLLRQNKIDSTDYFSQLLSVGEDLVGAVTVKRLEE
jgi:serine/threonine-protein kinase HipA